MNDVVGINRLSDSLNYPIPHTDVGDQSFLALLLLLAGF